MNSRTGVSYFFIVFLLPSCLVPAFEPEVDKYNTSQGFFVLFCFVFPIVHSFLYVKACRYSYSYSDPD